VGLLGGLGAFRHPRGGRRSTRIKQFTNKLLRGPRGYHTTIGMQIIALLSVGKVDYAFC
jgi:hypothetical protein